MFFQSTIMGDLIYVYIYTNFWKIDSPQYHKMDGLATAGLWAGEWSSATNRWRTGVSQQSSYETPTLQSPQKILLFPGIWRPQRGSGITRVPHRELVLDPPAPAVSSHRLHNHSLLLSPLYSKTFPSRLMTSTVLFSYSALIHIEAETGT